MSVAPLYPFFQWCDQTAIGAWVRSSVWIFPLIETIHILALTMLYGTVFVVNLRLLGAGLTHQPASRIAAALKPWMWGSLALMLTTGVLLFLSEALKCYDNGGFWFKMTMLLPALIVQFTIFPRVTSPDADARLSPFARKAAAVTSMALWLAVGIGGRAIGFV